MSPFSRGQLSRTCGTGRGGASKAAPSPSLRSAAAAAAACLRWGLRGGAWREEAGRSFGASLGSGLLGWGGEVSVAGNKDSVIIT